MNEISKKFAYYLMDEFRIEGTSEEYVDKAIYKIFNYELLDEKQKELFNEIFFNTLDVVWISEKMVEENDHYQAQRIEALREDYESVKRYS